VCLKGWAYGTVGLMGWVAEETEKVEVLLAERWCRVLEPGEGENASSEEAERGSS
jgi:hypothetical protein